MLSLPCTVANSTFLAAQLRDGQAHRFGNIEEFKVHKNFLAPGGQPVNQFVITAGHENLQAQLVEKDGVAQFFDPQFGLLHRGDIQGENEPFPFGNGLLREHRLIHRFTGEKIGPEPGDCQKRNGVDKAVTKWHGPCHGRTSQEDYGPRF